MFEGNLYWFYQADTDETRCNLDLRDLFSSFAFLVFARIFLTVLTILAPKIFIKQLLKYWSKNHTDGQKRNNDSNPAKDTKIVIVYQPAEYNLWNRSSCHDYHKHHCTEVFNSESDKYLTKCGKYANKYQVGYKIRMTLRLVFISKFFDPLMNWHAHLSGSKMTLKTMPLKTR